ncbi:ABC transporter substrate-binding protein [Photobacterium sp. TY1-4]|uniref:ABC transporter substrate-binding protein n=1 Tax=Photobacterium sp. TY1-4 TaxID=2899122 RepID=UPI0021C2051E|nr:sugar ABC transporter substrate-binding protein [Photobacterium sp. TY1-4]UXI04567.1 sugar ABC transporter substrate-binding protein [Photobacterium sp. TY1-4]
MFKINNLAKALLCTSILSATSVLAADKTEIRYGIWDRNQLPAVEAIIQKFEARNPDIDVEIELTPYKQYFVKLNAAASGGVTPDVFWMNMPNVSTYTKHGLLEPLDGYLKGSTVELDKFVNSSVQAYQVDGQQYGVPRDIDAIAVWYNKAIFDQAGVAYPTNDWTWDEMAAKAAAIQKATDDSVYPIMMNLTDGQETYFNLILQAGGDIIRPDKKTTDVAGKDALSAYKQVQQLMNKQLLPTAQQISELNMSEVFQSGRAAMAYSGSWNALPFSSNAQINDHIGVVTMPKIKRNAGVSHSIAYVMSRKTQHKAAAFRLLEFLSSDEAQSVLANSRTVIPAKKTVSHFWVEAFDTVDVSAYTKALETAHQYPTAANTAKWHSLLNDGLKKVWLGQNPEKVMPGVEKKVNRVLKKG